MITFANCSTFLLTFTHWIFSIHVFLEKAWKFLETLFRDVPAFAGSPVGCWPTCHMEMPAGSLSYSLSPSSLPTWKKKLRVWNLSAVLWIRKYFFWLQLHRTANPNCGTGSCFSSGPDSEKFYKILRKLGTFLTFFLNWIDACFKHLELKL